MTDWFQEARCKASEKGGFRQRPNDLDPKPEIHFSHHEFRLNSSPVKARDKRRNHDGA